MTTTFIRLAAVLAIVSLPALPLEAAGTWEARNSIRRLAGAPEQRKPEPAGAMQPGFGISPDGSFAGWQSPAGMPQPEFGFSPDGSFAGWQSPGGTPQLSGASYSSSQFVFGVPVLGMMIPSPPRSSQPLPQPSQPLPSPDLGAGPMPLFIRDLWAAGASPVARPGYSPIEVWVDRRKAARFSVEGAEPEDRVAARRVPEGAFALVGKAKASVVAGKASGDSISSGDKRQRPGETSSEQPGKRSRNSWEGIRVAPLATPIPVPEGCVEGSRKLQTVLKSITYPQAIYLALYLSQEESLSSMEIRDWVEKFLPKARSIENCTSCWSSIRHNLSTLPWLNSDASVKPRRYSIKSEIELVGSSRRRFVSDRQDAHRGYNRFRDEMVNLGYEPDVEPEELPKPQVDSATSAGEAADTDADILATDSCLDFGGGWPDLTSVGLPAPVPDPDEISDQFPSGVLDPEWGLDLSGIENFLSRQ